MTKLHIIVWSYFYTSVKHATVNLLQYPGLQQIAVEGNQNINTWYTKNSLCSFVIQMILYMLHDKEVVQATGLHTGSL